jgi:hypothetical protein
MVDWLELLGEELAYIPRKHLREEDKQYTARPEGLGSFTAQAHVKNCRMAHLIIEEANNE